MTLTNRTVELVFTTARVDNGSSVWALPVAETAFDFTYEIEGTVHAAEAGTRLFPFVFGTVNAVTAVVGAAAPIIAGLCFDMLGTYAPVLLTCAALCALGALAILTSRKPGIPDGAGAVHG